MFRKCSHPSLHLRAVIQAGEFSIQHRQFGIINNQSPCRNLPEATLLNDTFKLLLLHHREYLELFPRSHSEDNNRQTLISDSIGDSALLRVIWQTLFDEAHCTDSTEAGGRKQNTEKTV